MPVLILHYHEIWLKGRNRKFFTAKLKEAIKSTLEGLPAGKVRHEESRILVELDTAGGPDEQATLIEAVRRLTKVPGIAYLAIAKEVPPELDEIVEQASELMLDVPFQTFAVRAKRSRKTFPFRSSDIHRQLGRRIEEKMQAAGRPVKVNLDNPEVTCHIEVLEHRALVYTEKIPGLGGLPTGTAGRLVCLLSGGFDSAIAAYKIMRRGVRLCFVHFYGNPAQPGEDSPPIARELVKVLTPYQGRALLYLIPFTELQQQVVASAPQAVRILLYRRLMLRIAERIARRERAHGTVTGDSIAQVASQTLQNMAAVGSVATMPVYRPLVADDKQEILDTARRIGTYDISSEPFTDCCPIFLPKSPRIFSTIEELDAAEASLDIPAMVKRALDLSRKEKYDYRAGEVTLRVSEDRQSKHEAAPAGVVT
jgi:thiamine biosynthesis protein ThiI